MTLLGQSLYIPHKHTQSYELFVDFWWDISEVIPSQKVV